MGVCKHTEFSITPILTFPLAGGRNPLFRNHLAPHRYIPYGMKLCAPARFALEFCFIPQRVSLSP
jgi:hypothetical protein